MSERLQKLIANAGYGSRRWAERLIEQGRVSLNNHDVKLGDKAVLNDKVRIDGKLIDLKRYAETETKVLILNKQAGFHQRARFSPTRPVFTNAPGFGQPAHQSHQLRLGHGFRMKSGEIRLKGGES